VNKNKNSSKHQKLELKKETVVHLTDDLLKGVVGGSNQVIISALISRCGVCLPNQNDPHE
jgi:hypothetical protein